MNPIHLHLLINHLPIIGIAIGAIILLVGIIYNNKTVTLTAAWLLLVCSFSTWPVNMSGEKAEHALDANANFDAERIEHHEEQAKYFLFSGFATFLAASAFLISNRRKQNLLTKYSNYLIYILLIASLTAVYFSIGAGTSGGEIRHEEIR